jgi:cytoskeletal protein CcmA (bactofilin family)
MSWSRLPHALEAHLCWSPLFAGLLAGFCLVTKPKLRFIGARQEMALFSKEGQQPSAATGQGHPSRQEMALFKERQQPSATTAQGHPYLDKGSKIMGKLFFEGPVRIDGHVEGEISANDVVVIGENAMVTAQLRAAAVVIAGKIRGDIIAAKRVELRRTARAFVNITTPVLVVEEGAVFEGHCTMNAESTKDLDLTPTIAKQERLVPQVAIADDKPG